MPLQLYKRLDNGTDAGVWFITEPLSYFESRIVPSAQEKQFFSGISVKKRLERYCSRHLLSLLEGARDRTPCIRDSHGKPHLAGSDRCISISHSGPYIAAAISDRNVGIDIQVMHDKIYRIAPKFVNPDEFRAMGDKPGMAQLHMIWGAKECMYKAYGKRQLRFKEHIEVHGLGDKTNINLLQGKIRKDAMQYDYKILHRHVGEAMLVLALEEQRT